MENNIKQVFIANDIEHIEKTLEHRILLADTISNTIASPNYHFAVFYNELAPVGYICFENCIDHIDLISLAVINEFRKKHIAKQLLGYLESLNVKKMPIFLEVRESNIAAISLYESNNYIKLNERKNYYKDPIEDAVIYTKKQI